MAQPCPVRIDTTKIRDADIRPLCATVVDAVNCFYSDPENVRKFEAWLKEQESKSRQSK